MNTTWSHGRREAKRKRDIIKGRKRMGPPAFLVWLLRQPIRGLTRAVRSVRRKS